MTQYQTISGKEANDAKLVPITREYSEAEYWMLDKAIETLGDKQHWLVRSSTGITIARHPREVNNIQDEHKSYNR